MNNFKAQYKVSAGGAWQTKLSGTEHSCLQALTQLRSKHPFSRVINGQGVVVA